MTLKQCNVKSPASIRRVLCGALATVCIACANAAAAAETIELLLSKNNGHACAIERQPNGGVRFFEETARVVEATPNQDGRFVGFDRKPAQILQNGDVNWNEPVDNRWVGRNNASEAFVSMWNRSQPDQRTCIEIAPSGHPRFIDENQRSTEATKVTLLPGQGILCAVPEWRHARYAFIKPGGVVEWYGNGLENKPTGVWTRWHEDEGFDVDGLLKTVGEHLLKHLPELLGI